MACLQFALPYKTVQTNSTISVVVGLKCPANQAVKVLGVNIGLDGTNSAQAPAIIDLDQCTFAGSPPGTNSASLTSPTGPTSLDSGRPETIQSTCGKAWTTLPTVLTVVEVFYVPVYMGSAIVFRPLTVPLIAKGSGGTCMEVTQASSVTANASGSMTCEE